MSATTTAKKTMKKTTAKKAVKKAVKKTATKTTTTKPKAQVKVASLPVGDRRKAASGARSPHSNGQPIIIMGHTIGAIARGIGKSSGFISRLRQAKRKPSVRTLEALRAFFGLETLDQVAALFAQGSVQEGAQDVKQAAEGPQAEGGLSVIAQTEESHATAHTATV